MAHADVATAQKFTDRRRPLWALATFITLLPLVGVALHATTGLTFWLFLPLFLLYGVVPQGPREVSLTQPWADYYLLDADVDALGPDLTVELARSGKEIWLRAVATANAARCEAALHRAVDRLVEHGCRRLVVLAGERAAVVSLRRTTGLSVGWNDAVGDAEALGRVHTELGVRHFVARLELEGQGREGTGFDPSDLAALRTRLERERRTPELEARRSRSA